MLTVIGDLIADVIVLGASGYAVGTDNPAVITHTRGGSAANVAAAAAALVPVRFIGRVGADAEGEALAHSLAATGAEVLVQRDGRTGSIVVLVDESAERTMLTDRGAAAQLGPIEPGWLVDTRWLHLPLYGFVESGSRDALLEAARWARGRGIPISVDLSSVAAMRDLGLATLGAILEDLSPAVLFANADEALLFAQFDVPSDVTDMLVVKRGPEPVLIVDRGETVEIPVESVGDIVDTTGAGDAFAGGFLAAALSDEPAGECAKAGAALAAQALRRPGAL